MATPTGTARLRRWLLPETIIIGTVVLSFVAWAIPGESSALRGFSTRATLSLGSLLVILVWYAYLLAAVSIARRVGYRHATRDLTHQIPCSRETLDQQRHAYQFLTIVAVIGVAYAVAAAGSWQAISAALEQSSANSLNESLGGSAGLATLRYTPVVSAPFGVFLWLQKRVGIVSMMLNIAMLFIVSLFSSRLSLMLALVVLMYLLSRHSFTVKFRARTWLLLGAFVFVILTWLNYTRNANFYRQYGVTDPFQMNIFQVLSYLGAPAQVSVGVANGYIENLIDGNNNALSLLVPTFLRSVLGVNLVPSSYPSSVDVASNLTTNSVFADVSRSYGFAGLVATIVVYALLAYIFGRLQPRADTLALAAGTILYAFGEIWRIYLVNQGIFLFLLIIVIIASQVSTITRPSAWRKR